MWGDEKAEIASEWLLEAVIITFVYTMGKICLPFLDPLLEDLIGWVRETGMHCIKKLFSAIIAADFTEFENDR